MVCMPAFYIIIVLFPHSASCLISYKSMFMSWLILSIMFVLDCGILQMSACDSLFLILHVHACVMHTLLWWAENDTLCRYCSAPFMSLVFCLHVMGRLLLKASKFIVPVTTSWALQGDCPRLFICSVTVHSQTFCRLMRSWLWLAYCVYRNWPWLSHKGIKA